MTAFKRLELATLDGVCNHGSRTCQAKPIAAVIIAPEHFGLHAQFHWVFSQISDVMEPLKTPPGFLERTKNEKRRFLFPSKSKLCSFDLGWHIHAPMVSSKTEGF